MEDGEGYIPRSYLVLLFILSYTSLHYCLIGVRSLINAFFFWIIEQWYVS